MSKWSRALVAILILFASTAHPVGRCEPLFVAGVARSSGLVASTRNFIGNWRARRVEARFRDEQRLLEVYLEMLAKFSLEPSRDAIEELSEQAFAAQSAYVARHNENVKKDGGFLITPLLKSFIGEGVVRKTSLHPGGWVHYPNEYELREARVKIRDGFVYRLDGSLLRGLPPVEYVMNASGDIFIMPAGWNDFRYRHSSLSGGAPVAAAGTISIDKNGRIVLVTNMSGHYRPSIIFLEQFVTRLKSLGLDLDDAQIYNARR